VPDKNLNETISFIYNKKNQSPKYFELKKRTLLVFLIGLPTVTIISLILGGIGLIHTSPFHLIDNYKQNSKAREAISNSNKLTDKIAMLRSENQNLTLKISELTKSTLDSDASNEKNQEQIEKIENTETKAEPLVGLSTLSFFKPIKGQQDRTKPASLNLTGFKIVVNRDDINFLFNIIPTGLNQDKLSGHIIVLLKNELTIQVYPHQGFNGKETQINYVTGELFSTQRFRPVTANFLKPRKPGSYTFAIYIFAKNGDLTHYQTAVMPVRY
jgi:hypothetical protein